MPFVDTESIDIIQTGDTTFQLLRPVTYIGKHETFCVPAGQDTDFASVPVGLSWLIPRYGRWTKAAILHDYLWRCTPNGICKRDADGIFRRALRELGVPMYKRHIMWSAVRLTSIFKHGGLPGTTFTQMLHLLLLWVTSIVILAVPMIVVYAWTFLFFILNKFFSLFDRKKVTSQDQTVSKRDDDNEREN